MGRNRNNVFKTQSPRLEWDYCQNTDIYHARHHLLSQRYFQFLKYFPKDCPITLLSEFGKLFKTIYKKLLIENSVSLRIPMQFGCTADIMFPLLPSKEGPSKFPLCLMATYILLPAAVIL